MNDAYFGSTMQNVLAINESRFRRVVDAVRPYRPTIFRGLTWSQFGYALLLAITFGVARVLQVTDDTPYGVARYWIPLHLLCGFLVLLFAAALLNINDRRIPRPVALAIAVAVGCTLALQLNHWLLFQTPAPFGYAFHKLRVALLLWGLVAAAYCFMERSARRAGELRETELDRQRIETQMLEARLQVLQAQVEPHFLFNTLAHVQRLYQIDPVRGRSMLDSFCGYLCAALPQMRGSRSTLGREVELARAYLDTQRIRMGRRLRFEMTIPDEVHTAAFPPMMLLPLVENAIKHGLTPLREGGDIRIIAVAEGGALHITVSDTGVGFSIAELDAGTGIGLSNIRSRLAALYGAHARLTLRGNVLHGVIATIDLPLVISSGGAGGGEREQLLQTAVDPRHLGTLA